MLSIGVAGSSRDFETQHTIDDKERILGVNFVHSAQGNGLEKRMNYNSSLEKRSEDFIIQLKSY